MHDNVHLDEHKLEKGAFIVVVFSASLTILAPYIV